MKRVLSFTLGASLVLCVVVFGCGKGSGVAKIPDTPDGTVTFVAEGLAANQPQVLWDALPASYQNDITQLTHDFATQMDPELYNKVFALSQKAVAIIKDKKPYILESSLVEMAGEQKDDITQGWDTTLNFLETFLGSEISNLEAVKALDCRRYMETTGSMLMEQAAAASKNNPDDPYANEFLSKLDGMTTEVVSSDADAATLRITAPGEDPEEIPFVRVEERWVPKDLAENWTEQVAEAKAKVAELSGEEFQQNKVQAMMMLAMADTFLDQLAAIQSTEEFENLVQGLMGGFMGGGPQSGG